MAKKIAEPPCIECRRRKKKCGRQHPTCDQCAKKPASFTCKYLVVETEQAKDTPSNGDNNLVGPVQPAKVTEQEGENEEQEEVVGKQKTGALEHEKVKKKQEERKAEQEGNLMDVPRPTLTSEDSASDLLRMNATDDEGTARFKFVFARYLEIDEEAKQLVEEHNQYLSVLGLLGLLKADRVNE